jgi:hypothetical protein
LKIKSEFAMNKPNSKTQHGAVLAFCLVMLLLLTLAATRMIQQNKQQLEMGNSARLLTQEFANAEGILAEANNMIDGHASHIDNLPINDKSHQCKPTALSKQNTLLAGTALFQGSAILKEVVGGSPRAIILGVRCKSESGTEQVCSSYNSNGNVTCKANTDCKTVDDAIAAFTESTDLCYQNYVGNLDPNPICDVTLFPPWCNLTNTKCPKEIYTIQVISTDANGTTRQIVSDHVVGCG